MKKGSSRTRERQVNNYYHRTKSTWHSIDDTCLAVPGKSQEMKLDASNRFMAANTVPSVTLITPTYNRAQYLPETIESVLNQDYVNLEYIVLDDGSTDGTKVLLEQYGDRITWESHKNKGETRSVNKGLQMAQGEILGVVNSDDPILPGLVQTAVDLLQKDSRLLVVYPDWLMIDENSQLIKRVQTYDYSYLNMVRWHHCFPGPGALFRRKALLLEKGRDIQYNYVADYDYWLRLGMHGPFGRIPEHLATFRVHTNSASILERGRQMAVEHIQLVDNLYARPDLPDAILGIKREAYSSAYYIAGLQCMRTAPGLTRKYFVKSLLLSNSQPNGLPRSVPTIVEAFLPSLAIRLFSRVRGYARFLLDALQTS